MQPRCWRRPRSHAAVQPSSRAPERPSPSSWALALTQSSRAAERPLPSPVGSGPDTAVLPSAVRPCSRAAEQPCCGTAALPCSRAAERPSPSPVRLRCLPINTRASIGRLGMQACILFSKSSAGAARHSVSMSGCAIYCSRLTCLHVLTWQARVFNLGSSRYGSWSRFWRLGGQPAQCLVINGVGERDNRASTSIVATDTLWNSDVQAQQHHRVVCHKRDTDHVEETQPCPALA